jgi:hypothetical protein
MFGSVLKMVGLQKLTRLAWSNQLHPFLENTKVGGQLS